MNKEHMDKWTEINKFVQKLSNEERQELYEELKRSGAVENPAQYIETHLVGGIKDENENESNLIAKNMDGRWK